MVLRCCDVFGVSGLVVTTQVVLVMLLFWILGICAGLWLGLAGDFPGYFVLMVNIIYISSGFLGDLGFDSG